MKFSIILVSDIDDGQNLKTIKLLKEQTIGAKDMQVVLADRLPNGSDAFKGVTKADFGEAVYRKFDENASNAEIFSACTELLSGELVTLVCGADQFAANYFKIVYNKMSSGKWLDHPIAISNKSFDGPLKKTPEPYSSVQAKRCVSVDLDENMSYLPWFFEGTFIRRSSLADFKIDLSLGDEAEKDAFIRFLADHRNFLYVYNAEYTYADPKDNEFGFFQGMLKREWYYDSVDNFMLPLLSDMKQKYGEIPYFVQYFAVFLILCRMNANSNNRNKHVLSEQEGYEYAKVMSSVLENVEDAVVLNEHDVKACNDSANVKLLLFQIKHGFDSEQIDLYHDKTSLYAAFDGNVFYSTKQMRVNILFMNYVNDRLEIDGTFPDVFPKDKYKFYVKINDEKIEPEFNERYSLTKYFGCSAFKRCSFHVSVPINAKLANQEIKFVMKCGDFTYAIFPEYKSHTSRISGVLKNGYWAMDDKFICYHSDGCINISRASKGQRFVRQLKIFAELLKGGTKRTLLVFLGRLGYWVTKPYFRNKKIWMYYDKIYKGGDSSEYLFKYASKRNDGIKHYYLIDRHTNDYKRLKAEGYKPLKRNTIMHKLVFFNANMMIVSNSTVFAFNDFPLYLSAYIRDIVDFHVVCVQHGLSVQKIAIAQNRLRDNTRLYYCASPYEIKNLSHPVYDYVGYDALRLTGVPRYDGLVNRDKRQILLSPTWRMQSALLVSRNEGVQRDYNDHFKETNYYKVFNSLINDERLISAAKEYGYRIAYVLHPIVAAQADDFDKNDYVDIIPSTGDMSYEKVFCESSLMVTDYSGVQFDFAYMRKPLVYLHNNDIPQHYEEGTFHYDTMAFGEIVHTNDELIDTLIEYMKNDCAMKPEYKQRADDFFAFSDHNNCQRIYDDMIEYQKKNIK